MLSLRSIIRSVTRPFYVSQVSRALTISVDGKTPADLYREQPHLRTVVSFCADNVAQLTLQAFERVSDTDRKRVTDDPMPQLLKRPNADTTGFELMRSTVSDICLYDIAYWLVMPDADSESGWSIRSVPPIWVSNMKGGNIFAPETYTITPKNGNQTEVPAENMLVFHGYDPEAPYEGASPVEALKDVLCEQIAAWRYRQAAWKNHGQVDTYVARPKDAPEWDEESRNRFLSEWAEYKQKGAKAGSSPIIEDGMELKRLGFSAREDEYSEVTKLSLQTVASVYHVNPVMVGVLDNANFSNTREFRKMLYSETLGPVLQMIQDRLNTFLVPKVSKIDGLYLEFNIAQKLAGDFEEQASVLSTSTGSPWMTVNEARARQNLPALEGGDELIVPLNVTQGGQSSPQDGGEPSVAVEAAKEWFARLKRSVESANGAGKEPDWKRWEREIQADLVIKAGCDQYASGILAEKLTEIAKKSIEAKVASDDTDQEIIRAIKG